MIDIYNNGILDLLDGPSRLKYEWIIGLCDKYPQLNDRSAIHIVGHGRFIEIPMANDLDEILKYYEPKRVKKINYKSRKYLPILPIINTIIRVVSFENENPTAPKTGFRRKRVTLKTYGMRHSTGESIVKRVAYDGATDTLFIGN